MVVFAVDRICNGDWLPIGDTHHSSIRAIDPIPKSRSCIWVATVLIKVVLPFKLSSVLRELPFYSLHSAIRRVMRLTSAEKTRVNAVADWKYANIRK